MTDPPPAPYEQIGAESLRQLVDRFYDLMDELPEALPIRDMHPADLGSSRDKLFMFLSGWLGGPPLYIQTYGHPRLRARHLPFPIDDAARDQWILCMDRALEETLRDQALVDHLQRAFRQVADHMRNR